MRTIITATLFLSLALLMSTAAAIEHERRQIMDPTVTAASGPELAAPERTIASTLLTRLTYPSTIKAGRPMQVWHCRKSVKGCAARLEAFDLYFHEATSDRTYATDPWMLAAMAIKESGLNPYAVGGADEFGVMQLHPRNKHARGLKFYSSEKYREECRAEVGACQREIIMAAADVLESSIEACDGDIAQGLGMYNAGHCTEDIFYVTRVLEIRQELLIEATGPHDQDDDV